MVDQVRPGIVLDYTGMMQSSQNMKGFSNSELKDLQAVLDAAQTSLDKRREAGELDFSRLLPSMKSQLAEIIEYANQAALKFENFVVLGIGGSALGPMAVHQALNHYYYNELPPERRGHRPRLYVVDNIDPMRFHELLHILDPHKTLFNVISKSGNTSETMAQFMIIRDILRRECGDHYTKHIVVTTDKEKGNLLPIALKEGFQRFVIPSAIGGRFSELTPVGLLAAAICGIDVNQLLEGALEMDQRIRETKGVFSNPAQLRSALALLSWRKGKNISVLMPYADGLKTIADWYAQLWAESLGKRLDRQGCVVQLGQTPVKALGVTDQHSQVQLYVEGPDDKTIAFVTVGKFREDQEIPSDIGELPEDIQFLGGRTLAELLIAEQKATEYALTLAGRQHQKIVLPSLDAFHIGQLLVMLEWETAYMGELLNINAFDQPGVEEGKIGTYALMGRKGYEARRQEIEEYGNTRYLLQRK
ncbi:glucose-6-phosphate isomerase [Desulfosporosinus sp. BICA1-9]|uniref:glucose-6-phosphate isomerase n=1 Tax=Desulfosporosinus sp. BICA1-9 TaxID=1531958 RepID=UPI00054B4406|nr:glucose-6-phosphate isomerase [Desulfosporosinus sp. BICA1-9]KJS49340.1 MAG: glucose-6-phosphate isomerase [Peptococcaceae bacterium BRH_c23]KJS80707.1 MAG: glucose-6-phosphate isomerase [Desulfosporosinus sp. BICA1-9]HBW35656.1 glucose-6-phosphate isomerase [Desulfosporosinus sp.]